MKFKIKAESSTEEGTAYYGKIEINGKELETPYLGTIGTKAAVKGLTSKDLKEIGVSYLLVNTYHLYVKETYKIINNLGIHKFMDFDNIIMSDSGGFQVFSLGFGSEYGGGKILKENLGKNNSGKCNKWCSGKNYVKILEDKVIFKEPNSGKLLELSPEISMKVQSMIGSEFVVAFDECTHPLNSKDYTKKALERTKRWLLDSLNYFKEYKKDYQKLVPVVQGGPFIDLREESAVFIKEVEEKLDEALIGMYSIGGSFGDSYGDSKENMLKVIEKSINILGKEKATHLLGIGTVEDIFLSVEKGVDLFDCVTPTRMGRFGFAYVSNENTERDEKFRININKSKFKFDYKPLDENCECYVCKNFTRAYLRHLKKENELIFNNYMTYHNVYFFNNLMKEIRESIKKDYFEELKKEWLGT